MTPLAMKLLCKAILSRFQIEVEWKQEGCWTFFEGHSRQRGHYRLYVDLSSFDNKAIDEWLAEFKRLYDEHHDPVLIYAERLYRDTGDFVCDWVEGCETQEEMVDNVKDMLYDHARDVIPDELVDAVVKQTLELMDM